MSNSLAIAAVTETLRNLLADGLVGDIPNQDHVTVKPPDKARGDEDHNQVNVFLYHTSPNPAFTNADMPGQVRPGESAIPPLALNLFYLITAYGQNDDDRRSHRLLGKAMSILHDHSVLGREEIMNSLNGNDLHEQPERVRITPQSLTLDETSKLWNTFQTNYRISTTYLVSVVLIESRRASRTPLPVLSRGPDDRGVTAVAEASPFLTEIRLSNGKPGAELGDQLIIRGSSLSANGIAVRFQHSLLPEPIELKPSQIQITVDGNVETALSVKLPSLADDPQTPGKWPIGFYSIAAVVQRPNLPKWTTNSLAFALVPTVTLTAPATPPTPPEADAGDVDVTLTCVPQVRSGQRVELLFGDRVFTALDISTPVDRTAPTEIDFGVLEIPARDVPYTLRVRVDGVDSIPVDFAQSPPAFDPQQQIKVN